MGVESKSVQSRGWFHNFEQRLLVIAIFIAVLLSMLPLVIGNFVPYIASVYLLNAHIVVFLTTFSICLIQYRFKNEVARRLVLIIGITSFMGLVGHYWLLLEFLFFGFPLIYPNISAYISAVANLILLVGFVFVSIEQRQRSWVQLAGYFLITFFFAVCILSTYQMNLTFHPPVLPAIGTGLRILTGFFTAIFAWTFYFNKNPSKTVISRTSRMLIVLATLFLILGYTVFAFQYALGWREVSTFYYAGSISDVIILFGIFIFLVAVLDIFSGTLENMTKNRLISLRYELITRILIISSILIVVTLVTSFAMLLFGRMFLVYLSFFGAELALQIIGISLLIGSGVIVLVVCGITYFLSRWLYRPLAVLEVETAAVTEPGIMSYTEPSGLLFTELQGVSDSFTELVNELSRVHAELRRFTITKPRLQTSGTSQLTKLDYYLKILSNSITNRLQSIQSLSEVSEGTSNQEELAEIQDLIQIEIAEIHYLLKSVQLLRLIDSQGLPEFGRINLVPVLTELKNNLEEKIPESANQITLALPDQKVVVIGNEYVSQIFQPLLRLILNQDVGSPATIEVTFSKITEMGTDYWQISLSHPKWVLPEIEKVLLFRADIEQPQKANPNLLLVPALVEYFRGKFRVKNIVIDEPQYGTVVQVLLPQATRRGPKSPQNSGENSED